MIFLRPLFIILFSGALIRPAAAQPAIHPASFPFSGLTACSAKFADVFSAASNQAALCFMPSFTAGIYAENRFMIQQLQFLSMSVAFNGPSGALGINTRYSGSLDYHESMLGLAYAKNLGAVKLGIQFNYHLFSTSGLANQSLMSMETGAILKLSERIQASVHFIYPASLKKEASVNGKIAYAYSSILGCEISPAVYLALQLRQEEDKPPNLIASLRYAFAGRFFAVMGLSTVNRQPLAGAGWKWRSFRVELFIRYHFQLGPSPGLVTIYEPVKTDIPCGTVSS